MAAAQAAAAVVTPGYRPPSPSLLREFCKCYLELYRPINLLCLCCRVVGCRTIFKNAGFPCCHPKKHTWYRRWEKGDATEAHIRYPSSTSYVYSTRSSGFHKHPPPLPLFRATRPTLMSTICWGQLPPSPLVGSRRYDVPHVVCTCSYTTMRTNVYDVVSGTWYARSAPKYPRIRYQKLLTCTVDQVR